MARARRLCLCIALTLALGSPAARAASAASGTALDRYLNGLDSLSANFTQSVTDSHGTLVGAGSGRLQVQRPGKFRWDYVPQATASQTAGTGQVLVADGTNLWFYDRELAQVTVKPVQAALSSTPIMLLSGSSAQLHDSFQISGEASHDGLDWVAVTPRNTSMHRRCALSRQPVSM
jgi:outer membrane lipoprotein carrier protein